MDWLKITIETAQEGIEPVCARLTALGHDALEIEDASDFEEFVNDRKPFWQLVDQELTAALAGVYRVHCYVPEGPDARYAVEDVRAGMSGLREVCDAGLGTLSVTVSTLSEHDWMENWRRYYKPLRIGKRVLIQPAWEPLDNPEDRVVFWCEPGVSFGTGTHATTRLCLELLDEWVTPGIKMGDLGCGSGILSVTALLLGAQTAVAVDVDPQAVSVARDNAVRNGFDEPVMLAGVCDLLSEQDSEAYDAVKAELAQCDIVCANLVSGLLIRLAPRLSGFVKPGGRLFASGVLSEDSNDVLAALESGGFTHIGTKSREGWAALHLQRTINI